MHRKGDDWHLADMLCRVDNSACPGFLGITRRLSVRCDTSRFLAKRLLIALNIQRPRRPHGERLDMRRLGHLNRSVQSRLRRPAPRRHVPDDVQPLPHTCHLGLERPEDEPDVHARRDVGALGAQMAQRERRRRRGICGDTALGSQRDGGGWGGTGCGMRTGVRRQLCSHRSKPTIRGSAPCRRLTGRGARRGGTAARGRARATLLLLLRMRRPRAGSFTGVASYMWAAIKANRL